jgi:hypothetical protein
MADLCRLYSTVAVWLPMSAAAAPKRKFEKKLKIRNSIKTAQI